MFLGSVAHEGWDSKTKLNILKHLFMIFESVIFGIGIFLMSMEKSNNDV